MQHVGCEMARAAHVEVCVQGAAERAACVDVRRARQRALEM